MISVAMATYNGARYLSEQLDSILSQTYKDFELVICDDCSSDSTLEVLKKYAQVDSRIKVFENESNLGYAKNFEKAISLCSGEYIALSDQDDVWTDNHLSVLLDLLTARKCSLAGANALLVDENNKSLECKLINNGNFPDSINAHEMQLLYKNIFQGAAILFEKTILQKALPFPESIRFHDWWLALVASDEKGVFYEDIPIVRYRQHGNNVSGVHNRDSLLQKVRKLFSFDETEIAYRRLSVLDTFSTITIKYGKVHEVIEYSKNCADGKFAALAYFSKHHKEMHYGEGFSMCVIRYVKLLLHILF